ncbi:hypothetical protein BS47DRAFT_1342841 [Hydnum rufescens UP504]|uniref:Uncharacterized protein n=1 Tax=Hydnum rufescens UP504 TaxID=1448309 RepID=A0A9P6B0E1_9AGAM|nr:hypothetical protein BS47DRAFT_1342841 [Hydnum rufescens UP504]
MGSNPRSGLLKRLTKAFPGPRRFVHLFSKQLSSPDFLPVKGPLDSAEPSPPVQPSEESSLAPPLVESSDHIRSRQSPAVLAPSPPPALMPNHGYPRVTLKIKTGSGGSAQGPVAIGGDAGSVGYISERPRIDLANSGMTNMAIAGRDGRVGAISTLINLQQESYHIDIETGAGGTANSTEIGDTNTRTPDDSCVLGLDRISDVYEATL